MLRLAASYQLSAISRQLPDACLLIAFNFTHQGLMLIGLVVLAPWQPSRPNDPTLVEPGEETLRIHRESIVIDLHVDTLLWPRDLNRESDKGHLDFPRMREGGLDASVFTIPTRFFGLAGLKSLRDGWPSETWFSP